MRAEVNDVPEGEAWAGEVSKPSPGGAGLGLRGYRTLDPERSAARRRAVLHAAACVFAAKGYYTATTEDIARAMGVTKGVIYYYFLSKEDIYLEVVCSAIEGAQRRLEAIAARHTPALDTLSDAIADLIEYNLSEREEGYYAMLVIHNLSALSKENLRRVRELQHAYRKVFCDILQRGIDEHVFIDRDVAVTANSILNAANFVSDWFNPHGRLSIAEVADHVADQLVRGVVRPEVALAVPTPAQAKCEDQRAVAGG